MNNLAHNVDLPLGSHFMETFERLTLLVQSRHPKDDPSHDFSHIERVRKICEEIGKQMSAKMEILIPATLLHDIVNIPKNHPDRTLAADLAAAEATQILRDLGIKTQNIAEILKVIREHSFSAGRAPSSLESAILQDADRLDALGAIGIARTFSCGTRLGSKFYDDLDILGQNRSLDDKKYMLDHFYKKLLTLAEKMNTPQGKIEAEKRTLFMRQFLEQFKSEVTQSIF